MTSGRGRGAAHRQWALVANRYLWARNTLRRQTPLPPATHGTSDRVGGVFRGIEVRSLSCDVVPECATRRRVVNGYASSMPAADSFHHENGLSAIFNTAHRDLERHDLVKSVRTFPACRSGCENPAG